MEKIPMTPRGQQRLREELKRLREVERPQNIADIEEARAHGDISENAEFEAAKHKQAFIEGRMREIDSKLALANVIDVSKLSGDKVVFGATVTVADTETDEETTYTIVGEDEADIKLGLISVTAPVARSLIGREVGDTVKVKTPKGQRELEVVSVKFVEIP
jgi:transcription elongation factor GreA